MKTTYSQIDSQNLLGFLDNTPKHYQQAMSLGSNIRANDIERIIICGMGGSAIAGDLLKSLINQEINTEVIKEYTIPDYHDRKTLAFIISYSGNTEETISAYRKARRLGCKTILITSNGHLQSSSKINMDPLIAVPKGIQPRAAIPYLFFPMLNVLISSGLVDDYNSEYEQLIKALNNPKLKETGKELAEKIGTKTPLIYGSPFYKAVAYRWKTQFNENSKIFAFNNAFSELNHNELEAYENNPQDYFIITLSDNSENRRIKDRIRITNIILKEKNLLHTQLNMSGTSRLTKLFTTVLIGDYTSLFHALQRGIDPSPVKVIENFKEKL